MAATTLKELDEIKSACRKMVSRRALLSAAAAVVLYRVDVGTKRHILCGVLPQINEKFGLKAPSKLKNYRLNLKSWSLSVAQVLA